MQTRISIVPFFHPSFKGLFPKLNKYLLDEGVEIDDYKVSLYHLITELERILFKQDLNPLFKEVIEKYRQRLTSLHRQVEQRIATATASEIDPILYDIEDAFAEFEKDLM
jgi:hypothetical protein